MMRKILMFVRNNEYVLGIASFLFNILGLNRFKGKSKLGLKMFGAFLWRCRIKNYGNGNRLEIEKGCRLYRCSIQFFGNDNHVVIQPDCELKDADIWISDGGVLSIGHNTHLTGRTHIACIEGKQINIGERCLFSNDIVLRTGDSHAILDSSGNRVNYAKDILIGDHVWVGQKVIILKGAIIGSDSIIGTGAVVTNRNNETGVVLAGNPAKIVKKNVTWDPHI